MVIKRTEDDRNATAGQPFTLPDPARLAGFEEAARQLYDAGITSDAAAITKNQITEQDVQEIANTVKMLCGIAGVGQAEIDQIIEVLRQNVGAPKDRLDDVRRAAKEMAEKAVSETAIAKNEPPEQKMDRLWKEIDKLNAQASERLDKLPLNDEQKAKRKELEEAVEKAKHNKDKDSKDLIEAQKALIEFYEKMGIEYSDPELIALAKKMKANVQQVETIAKSERKQYEMETKNSKSEFAPTPDTANSIKDKGTPQNSPQFLTSDVPISETMQMAPSPSIKTQISDASQSQTL